MKQTRKQQQQIIAAAMQDGSINNLLWYMVSDLGGGKDIAAAVNDVVPVVRVGPNPELSEHDAHIMLEICREKSPKMFLRLEITAQDILDDAGVAWIEFGDVDVICPYCAGINWESCCCQPNIWVASEVSTNESFAV